LGRTTTVAIDEPENIGLVVFKGRRGQRIGVDLKGEASGGSCVGFALRAPGGLEQIVSFNSAGETTPACGEDPEFPVPPPPLPVTGTYTLVVEAVSEPIKSLDVTIHELSDEEAAAADEQARQAREGDQPPPSSSGSGGLPEGVGEPVELEPGPLAQQDGPWGGAAAFPVNLSTGVLASQATDLVVDDVLPLVLGRSYQLTPFGTGRWAFGKGAALEFDMWLRVGAGHRIADLELPNGAVVPFDRVNEGFDVETAVFEPPDNPTMFNGSRIEWTGAGWDVVMTGGTRLVFGQDGRTPLRAMRDASGNQIVVRRQAESSGPELGKVVEVYSPSGRRLGLSYDDQNRVVQATDQIGRTVSYSYDDGDHLAGVTYPGGRSVGYSYDSDDRLVTVTGPDGTPQVTNSYDDDGRVVSQVLADGTAYQFSYTLDDNGLVEQTDMTDPNGIMRRIGLRGGYWFSDTSGAGTAVERSVMVDREALTRLVTVMTDPVGRRTNYAYDELGFPTAVTQLSDTPGAITTQISYEPEFHQVAAITDPLGRSVRYDYDHHGNRVVEDDPYGRTTYSYDRNGRLTSTTDPTGHTTEVGYSLGHQVTVTDPQGNRRSSYLDAVGRPAVISDPAGNQTRLSYDDLDQLIGVTTPAGASTGYGYDAMGRLVSITDANGNATSVGYDPVGRVLARVDPLGAVDSYGYDLVGNLLTHTDRRGVVSAFAYDSLGRQTNAAFGVRADGSGAESTIDYAYDAAGRLSDVVDSTYGPVHLDYNDLDRLAADTNPVGRISYSYDEFGRRTAMALDGGPETRYAYDDLGLAAINQGAMRVGITPDKLGRLASLRLPNDVSVDYRYNAAGGLSGIDYQAGDGELGDVGYRYDPAGRRIGLTGSLADTELPSPLSDAAYGPGNRLTQSGDGRDLSYDAAGNLVSDGTNTYTWDARGQLTGIAGADGTASASFTYDPFGRRNSKTVDGTTSFYLYDGPNMLQQRVGSEDPVTYLTGLEVDQVYARVDGDGGISTYLADGLGSTLGLVDRHGSIATRYASDPYGGTRARGDDDSNPFGFTGRELDETGLYYYRSRYYAPETGRFISEDPLGHAAGDPNLYAYVGGSPTNFVDPSGQCVSTALYYFNQSSSLLDEQGSIFDAYNSGQLSDDELSAALDNQLRKAMNNLNDFMVLCGAEVTAYQFLASLTTALPTTPTPQAGSTGGPGTFSRSITIRPGLSPRDFTETLPHETVHSILSPTEGSFLANFRADLLRFGGEAIAESDASQSLVEGLRSPFAGGYVTPTGLALEAAAVGGTSYPGYQATFGN
jgi:RHS repeat-associated protein